MSKLIFEVGYNSRREHKTKIGGNHTLAYKAWYNMIRRCYCAKGHVRYPTYTGCSVDKIWQDFQDFADWFENHEHSNRGYHLDKDILIVNNKVYSPETCCFVPHELNSLLLGSDSARGDYPQGVYLHKPSSKYKAQMGLNGKQEHLGYFDTPQEAYQAYRIAKEANVKRMALEWQDRIADNVFQALMSWQLAE